MNTLFAGMMGGWEIVLILAVVVLLFGAKKLPELAKGLGQGIKEFKKSASGGDEPEKPAPTPGKSA
jgi:sec-independent protein translocase protein TatA